MRFATARVTHTGGAPIVTPYPSYTSLEHGRDGPSTRRGIEAAETLARQNDDRTDALLRKATAIRQVRHLRDGLQRGGERERVV